MQSQTIARPKHILPIIILSQFAGTAVWFASNAVMADLQAEWHLMPAALGYMTSAVQLGFIIGTLIFAFFTIADRFSPRLVFLVCALAAGVANLSIYLFASGLTSLLVFRFLTGFFLAGIYPVGMKIAAGWYQKGLGNALGFLVGALVLGTAFPHLLKSLGAALPWQEVIIAVSFLSAVGGMLMYWLVPDGPFLKQSARFNGKALTVIFRSRELRLAAFGYFGHMWELYAFWAFVPVFITGYSARFGQPLNTPFWAFAVIAMGAVGCAVGGIISIRRGSSWVAYTQLAASAMMCLLSPLLFHLALIPFLAALLFWGIVVVGDSPQFSALAAQTAPANLVGSALTIINSIGFAITIVSIEFLNRLRDSLAIEYLFLLLMAGPALGFLSIRTLRSLETVKEKKIPEIPE